MAEEDVPSYIPKNVITRSLGPHENVNIDLEGPFDAAPGDVFLLCSDGLSGQINDAEIGALLHCLDPKEAVQTLADLANLRGGPDNISVIVARIPKDDSARKSRCAPTAETMVPGQAKPSDGIVLPVASIVALFALTLCLVNEWWIASAVAGVALLTLLGITFSKRSGPGGAGTPASLGGPYGNGPYRDTPAEPNEKIITALAEIMEKLRGIPAGQGPKIDWKPLDESIAEGKRAAENRDYCAAVRHYSTAVRAIMQQLRQHRQKSTDDSSVGRG
jgi:protein phosphatase